MADINVPAITSPTFTVVDSGFVHFTGNGLETRPGKDASGLLQVHAIPLAIDIARRMHLYLSNGYNTELMYKTLWSNRLTRFDMVAYQTPNPMQNNAQWVTLEMLITPSNTIVPRDYCHNGKTYRSNDYTDRIFARLELDLSDHVPQLTEHYFCQNNPHTHGAGRLEVGNPLVHVPNAVYNALHTDLAELCLPIQAMPPTCFLSRNIVPGDFSAYRVTAQIV